MRWLVLCAGGLATAAMLGISMRVNFLFGYSLGQTPERAEVFGWVSVISDLWKALGPICFIALFRAKRQWAGIAASEIWAVLTLLRYVGRRHRDRGSLEPHGPSRNPGAELR